VYPLHLTSVGNFGYFISASGLDSPLAEPLMDMLVALGVPLGAET